MQRGAEVAFLAIASELASSGDEVTLFGSGPPVEGAPYHYRQSGLIARERFERFPKIPALRGETAWEELSFMPGFLRAYRPQDFDATMTCSYPFLNWALRAKRHRGIRPAHVFVTQNGDWPARSDKSEYRLFGCDGLVAINPDYAAANRDRFLTRLIPNGADLTRFMPGPGARDAFNLPADAPVVLMVSALIPSKFVDVGIKAVGAIPGAHLVVAGDGPLRSELTALAETVMPGRYHNFTVTASQMPDLYRSVDAFLHLSRDESFGNVFVEAMATDLTTVAWDLPRTRWITGETALLAPDGDREGLIALIAEALAGKKVAGSARQRANQFSWATIARQYRDFFEEIHRLKLTSKGGPSGSQI